MPPLDLPDFSDLPDFGLPAVPDRGGAEIAEAMDGANVRQFTVFLQNRVGALSEMVRLLNGKEVHVLGLSIQDSSDYAIIRLVVSDPELVETLFMENGVAHSTCDLVVAELQEGAAQMRELLGRLLLAEINIHFAYPLLVRPNGRAVLALHVEDFDCAYSVLAGGGFNLLSQVDISR